MAPSMLLTGVAAFAVAASSGSGAVLAVAPLGLKGQLLSISPHDGATAFNQNAEKGRALSTVESELMNALMDDPTIGDMLKDSLREALASMVGSLSEAAKESCEKIVSSAKSKIAEASDSVEHAIENLDEEGAPTPESSLVQQGTKALTRSSGFFDSLKEKAKSAWTSVKGAATNLMHKVGEKLKPIIEKALAQIVPKLQSEASDLLGKACNLADKKLQAVESSLSK